MEYVIFLIPVLYLLFFVSCLVKTARIPREPGCPRALQIVGRLAIGLAFILTLGVILLMFVVTAEGFHSAVRLLLPLGILMVVEFCGCLVIRSGRTWALVILGLAWVAFAGSWWVLA